MIAAYLLIIFFFSFFQNSKVIDSLETVLQTTKVDTVRIAALNELAWKFRGNNPDTSIYYAKQALILAQKTNWQKGIAVSYQNLGSFNWRKSNYSIALAHYSKALKIYKEFKDQKRVADIFGSIGVIYGGQGDFPKALEYIFKALTIKEEFGDKSGITRSLNNIGGVYYGMEDFSNALEYFLKSLAMNKESGDKDGIAGNLGNIGSVYHYQGVDSKVDTVKYELYNSALEHYFKGLELYEELGNKRGIANGLLSIGNLYFNQGKLAISAGDITMSQELFSKARERWFKALKIYEEIGDKINIALTFSNIGLQYKREKKYSLAESYLLQALEISTEIGALYFLELNHNKLSELYKETGQYKKAYEHLSESFILRDSLFNEEKSKAIGKIEGHYEFEKEEAERKKKEEEQAKLLKAERFRRANLQYSGILIFFIFLIIAIALSGSLAIPVKLAEGLIFFTFLLFFESCLVFLDPYIEQLTGDEPIYKLLINGSLAILFIPLHQISAAKLKLTLFKTKKKKFKKSL